VPYRCSFGIDISTLLNPVASYEPCIEPPRSGRGRLLQRFPPTSPRTRDHIWSCGSVWSGIFTRGMLNFRTMAFKLGEAHVLTPATFSAAEPARALVGA
jgi:hypothetical protein